MKYKFFFLCFFLLVMTQAEAQRNAPKPKGNLFIIGGGSRSPELIRELLRTADLRPKDHIVVLPMSSAEPEASFASIAKEFSTASTQVIGNLNFDAAKVKDKVWLDSLRTARLIFITGGDQSRFMKAVLHTPVYEAIHEAYRNGATIAGTSAGAAVMSKYMITGEQLLGDTSYRATFDKLWKGNVVFEEGMGLLDSVIIDQHFVKRSRYNRLLSALAAHPTFDCIGIDEGTAIVVSGKKIRVAGVSQVLSISDPKELKVTEKGHLKMKNLRFSIYTDGDSFIIK